jgi:hypothetical protein
VFTVEAALFDHFGKIESEYINWMITILYEIDIMSTILFYD